MDANVEFHSIISHLKKNPVTYATKTGKLWRTFHQNPFRIGPLTWPCSKQFPEAEASQAQKDPLATLFYLSSYKTLNNRQ